MIRATLAPKATLLAAILCACGPDPIERCEAHGDARVVCGLQNPEDLAVIPESMQLLVSQFGSMHDREPGAIALLDLRTGRISTLFPQDGIGKKPSIAEGPDLGDARCDGPPDERFSPHGIDLAARSDGRQLLYVVNHGGREAIEIFELVTSDETHALSWRGCVPAPKGVFLNDVAALPEGFVTTHMFEKGSPFSELVELVRASLGRDTGYVLEWRRETGLRKVPGTSGPFLNGIAASRDGREIFVNVYMANEVRRIERTTGKLLGRVEVRHPDNLSWADDGRLLVASHTASLLEMSACGRIERGACGSAFEILALDPETLAKTTLVARRGPPMGAATVAVTAGRELVLGSFRSDRLLRLPRPD